MTGTHPVEDSANGLSRIGWSRLVAVTAAQGYLTFVLTLAAIALLPYLLGWHGTVVQSGSMEPHISAGDFVLGMPLPESSPVPVGGVVEYRSPAAAEPDGIDKLRLHRVVADNGDGTFVTAGDANRDVDSAPLTREQITGQARLLVPLIGLPGLWMGKNEFVPLGVWGAFTALALMSVALWGGAGRERRGRVIVRLTPRARRPAGAVTASGAVILIAGMTAIVGLTAIPQSSATAAFTERTSTAGNAWTVATFPALTAGRAAPYALLAATQLVVEGAPGQSRITGSVGTSPGQTITGHNHVTGSVERGTLVARNAMTDARALRRAVDLRVTTATRQPTLIGTILPGVYTSTTGSFTTSGNVVLDARGDASAVFIFRGTAVRAATNSTVTLRNGASARNVFWVADTVELGQGSMSRGIYLANGAITMMENSRLEGALVSFNAGMSLNRAHVTVP